MSTPPKQANTQARTVQLCRWNYDGLQGQKVEIFVDIRPVAKGAGFSLEIEYSADAYEFSRMAPDSAGDLKEVWAHKHKEQFLGVPQSVVQAHVEVGIDPLFELFKTDKEVQTKLRSNFPKLASSFDLIALGSAAGPASSMGGQPTL